MNPLRNRVALRTTLFILASLALAPLLAAAQTPSSGAAPATAPAVQPAAQSAETATAVGATVCASCHTEKADAFKKSWHGRKMPEMKDVPSENTCESCHGPGSLHVAAAGDKTNPGYATTKISAEATNDRCLSCHNQKKLMNWKVGQHNQQGLACATCHKIHEAGANSPKPKSEVCLDCHKKKRMEMNLPFHHPIAEGKMECYDCHNPHGGDFRNLTAESVNETCAKCHAEKLGPFQQEHPPVAENCTICHNPHGSINEGLLKQSQPNLCLGCHKFAHSSTNVNPTGTPNALLQHSRCTNCHFNIHGNDNGSWFTK
jgi:DmsE family decaheme c-type cytochrome